jgi:hypothetical protein
LFQLYCGGGQFYWWRKPVYPEKTINLKTVALSYSLKTGELVQAGQTKKLYGKDHVGKIVKFKMSPLCEGDNIFYKLKIPIKKKKRNQYKSIQ